MPSHHRAAMRHHAARQAEADAEPASAPPIAAAVTPVATAPSAVPAPSPPVPESTTAGVATAPHVTVLNVKMVTPFVDTTALPRQNAPEQNGSNQTSAPSTAQPPSPDGNTPAAAGNRAAAKVDAAATPDKADAAFSASAQPAEAATDAARTRTAEGFILLAAAFGVAAALTAIIGKIVGLYRAPRISLDPDAAWVNYRAGRRQIDAVAGHESDVPFLDPQEHYGLGDLHAQQWLDRPSPDQDQSSEPPRTADAAQPQSPRLVLSEIEAALQALRQARQSRVA